MLFTEGYSFFMAPRFNCSSASSAQVGLAPATANAIAQSGLHGVQRADTRVNDTCERDDCSWEDNATITTVADAPVKHPIEPDDGERERHTEAAGKQMLLDVRDEQPVARED